MDFFIPYNSIERDRVHMAEDFARFLAAILTDGVHPNPGNSLFVSAAGGWNLNLEPGKCVVGGGHLGENYSRKTFTIDPPTGTLPRIDSFVVRHESTGARDIHEMIVKGTPSSTPVAKPLQRDADAYDMCLAQIYVAANATYITQANITDTRRDSNLCGTIHSLIKIDPDTLFAQWEAIWDEWIARYREMTMQEFQQFQQNSNDLYESFFNLVSMLTGSANDKMTVYNGLLASLTSLANTRNLSFLADQDALQQASYQQVAQWFNRLQAESEADVADLVSALQGMLTGDAAVELLARIIAHEQKQVASEEGAHGNRYWNKAFQVRTAEGWITVVGAVVEGIRAVYFNQMGWTAAEFNALFMTGEDFNSLREVS